MPSPFTKPIWYNSTQAGVNPLDSLTNALLPYMSEEAQRIVGLKLGTTSPNYASYRDAAYSKSRDIVNSDTRRQFLSADRAYRAMSSLQNMKNVGGYTDATLGPGYKYLQDIVGTMKRLGGSGSGGMTRAQQSEFRSTVGNISDAYTSDPNTAESSAPYSNLTQYFATPSFSAGDLFGKKPPTVPVRNPRLYK